MIPPVLRWCCGGLCPVGALLSSQWVSAVQLRLSPVSAAAAAVCSSNQPAAHWARILCHGATGRGATDCCASGDTSHHPHGSSSDIPPRAMTLADWSGNTREIRKNDGGLWRMYKRFPPIQVRRAAPRRHITAVRKKWHTFFYAWFFFFFYTWTECFRLFRICVGINSVNDVWSAHVFNNRMAFFSFIFFAFHFDHIPPPHTHTHTFFSCHIWFVIHFHCAKSVGEHVMWLWFLNVGCDISSVHMRGGALIAIHGEGPFCLSVRIESFSVLVSCHHQPLISSDEERIAPLMWHYTQCVCIRATCYVCEWVLQHGIQVGCSLSICL